LKSAALNSSTDGPTGRTFHRYLNPERDIDAGAMAVHGIKRADAGRQTQVSRKSPKSWLAFIADAELVIHNAAFDVAFLDAELARHPGGGEKPPLGVPSGRRSHHAGCWTRWRLRARLHPGQRNNLDALCKRYGVDNSHRDLHGALLDARFFADVYLAMTGGQAAFALDERSVAGESIERAGACARPSGLAAAAS
jgi:DNA polymerase-3 subunit epsilon